MRILWLSVVLLVRQLHAAETFEDNGSYHFLDATSGRASWIVESESLPWIGSFDYLSNEAGAPTVLMTVVDSSTGAPLGECSVISGDPDAWEHFIWTLTADSLTCNVSETNSSRVRFPMTAHPRTFSVRIQSTRGPRCLKDLIVDNDKPLGCPPLLRRNSFTSAGLQCSCPYADSTESESDENPEFPLFPMFKTAASTSEPIINAGPCANFGCENNGTCVIGENDKPVCACPNGFSGSKCQLNICAAVPCSNGGKCKANGSTAVCECPPHTQGILCEQIVCEPACAQGECVLVDGAPMCQCNQGFIGPNCNVIDVCIGDAACAVFGEHAKCTLDAASYTKISTKVVNATYDCHCPHPKTGQWMDCLALVLSSTQQPVVVGSGEVQVNSTSTPPATTSTIRVPIIPLNAHNVVTATAGSNRIITVTTTSTPTTATTTTTLTSVSNATQPAFIPFQPNLAVSTIAPSTEETEEESEETQAPSLNFRPFPSVPVAVQPSGSSAFPTPAPIDTSTEGEENEEDEEENLGAGFETMTAENGPDPTEMSTTNEPSTEETSSESTAMSWPSPIELTSTPIIETSTIEDSSSAETTDTTLPFWMVTTTMEPETEEATTATSPSTTTSTSTTTTTATTTTTTPTTTTTEEVEEEEEEEETVEAATEPPRSNNVPPEHVWVETTQKPEETTTSNEIAGSAGQASSSAASIIIAIIAVCLIGLLLLAGAFFTMRYVRQSRKLHGKYNPAREEHALSAAYSLPMTHVSKEERLI